MKKSLKVFSLLLVSLLILTGCGKKKEEPTKPQEPETPIQQEETIDWIVDKNSTSRPYAVMINNHSKARPLQSGLQDAYIVYEMLVEGGITRMMALFKDANTTRIGSVRSARHTYLDYVLENDAYYCHFGWSNIAQEQIPKLGVNNINGLTSGGYWRDKTLNVPTEHTVFTSLEKLAVEVKNKNYRTKTNKDLLLNYSEDELDLSSKDGAVKADNVAIKFSSSNKTSFEYDTVNKVYKRSVNGKANTDYVTKKQFTTKNLIITKIKNFTVDSAGHQELKNIGEGTGYYVTNGYSVPIKWSKKSRSEQTVYTYLDGTEIVVNNGNTFIEIAPLSDSVTIK